MVRDLELQTLRCCFLSFTLSFVPSLSPFPPLSSFLAFSLASPLPSSPLLSPPPSLVLSLFTLISASFFPALSPILLESEHSVLYTMYTRTRNHHLPLFLLLFLSHLALTIAADDGVICSQHPPLLPHYYLYRDKCEDSGPFTFDLQWPCFQHRSGSLLGADVLTSYPSPPSNNIVYAKNADLKEFTPRNASSNFIVRYQYAGISMHYIALDSVCLLVVVERWDKKKGYKMWVTDDEGDEEVIAHTDWSQASGAHVCTKWVHLHLEKEK